MSQTAVPTTKTLQRALLGSRRFTARNMVTTGSFWVSGAVSLNGSSMPWRWNTQGFFGAKRPAAVRRKGCILLPVTYEQPVRGFCIVTVKALVTSWELAGLSGPPIAITGHLVPWNQTAETKGNDMSSLCSFSFTDQEIIMGWFHLVLSYWDVEWMF